MPYPDDDERDEAQRILDEAGLDRALETLAGREQDGDRGIAPPATPQPSAREQAERIVEDERVDERVAPLRQVGSSPGRGAIIEGGPPPRVYPAGQLPLAPRAQAIEDRLRAGDRAGVVADTRRDQAGDPVEDRALEQMARPAVTQAAPAPMGARAQGTGADPGMSLPDPAQARRRPQSFQLQEQAWADATDAEPWFASGDEPPSPGAAARLDVDRDLAMEPDADADDAALEQLASGGPAMPRAAARESASALGNPAARPPLQLPGFGPAVDAGPRFGSVRPAKPAIAASTEFAGGIPGDEALGRARTEDAFRNPLHRLANALRVLGGRSPTAFRSNEAAVRERQQEMLDDKRQDLQRQQQQARQDRAERRSESQQEFERGMAERTASRADEQLELARSTAARQDATAAAQAERLREQALAQRSDRELAERRRTPGTEEARRAQTELQSLVEALPPGPARDRVVESLVGPGARIDELSAEQLERVEQRLPEYLRAALRRGGSGGGAGGGARRQGLVDATRRLLTTSGMSEEDADAAIAAVGPTRAARSALTSALTDARAEGGHERRDRAASGRRADTDTERLGRAMDGSLNWQQSLRRARQVDPSLLRTVLLSQDIPAGFTPEQVQAARGAVLELRGALQQMRSGATVSEQEVERIQSEMGVQASSSPEVFGRWLEQQEANQREREQRIRARFSDDVVRTYDERLRRESGGAPGSASGAPAGDTITVRRRSDGRTRQVSREAWAGASEEERARYEAVQ